MNPVAELFLNRQVNDHLAALGAFLRLYRCASIKGDAALQAIAVLKAIQKLEQIDDEEAGQAAPRPILLPTWVREGLWDALGTLTKNSPAGTAKNRPVSFKNRAAKILYFYATWASVVGYELKHDVKRRTAINKVSEDGKGDPRAVKDRVGFIDELISEANALDVKDNHGLDLPYIEARDLIPTQKLRTLVEKFA